MNSTPESRSEPTATTPPESPDHAPRTETTVRVGLRDIFVTQAGPSDGTPVVLLHGGGPGATGASNYVRNIDAFVAAGLNVVVPDMPGYGGSSKLLDQSDPFGDLAFFVRGLIDELGLGSAHVVGNSYGGAAALRLAMDRPDKVRSLVLMGPGGIGTTRGLPTKGLSNLLAYYGGDGPSREKVATFIREYLVHAPDSVPDELIDLRYQASIDPEVVANPPLRKPKPGLAGLRTLWRMDLTRDKRLSTCATPTLVVWGEDDQVNRPAGGTTLVNTMPNCRLETFAETGHWAQWEQADTFNALAVEFISGHDRASNGPRS